MIARKYLVRKLYKHSQFGIGIFSGKNFDGMAGQQELVPFSFDLNLNF